MEDNKYKGFENYNPYLVDEAGQFPWHYKKDFKIFWKVIEEKPLKYLDTLPKAYEIYESLFGEPKTHEEWAERFNKVGMINRIIMKE